MNRAAETGLSFVQKCFNINKEENRAMAILKEAGIPIGRMLFIPKEGNLTRNDLEIESTGQYQFLERPDCFVVKNAECCRSISVKVKTKES